MESSHWENCNKQQFDEILKCYWGAERDTLCIIYIAMIRSVFDYGCLVYSSAASTMLNRLDVVQVKVLRLCCWAFHATLISALLIEMGRFHCDYIDLEM